MDELQYQLNLLKALNQKLSDKERLYKMVCESTDSVFLYYNYQTQDVNIIGKWDELFDFQIKEFKDLSLVFDAFDEPYIQKVKDIILSTETYDNGFSFDALLKDLKTWISVKPNVFFDNDNKISDKVICFTDVTKFIHQREELQFFAYYDVLTGLYNRNYFVGLLNDMIAKASADHEIVSVLMVDIDDFHKINDGMGMVVGDEVVQQFGNYLKELTCHKTIACHLNSDVYCMAIYGPDAQCNAKAIHGAIKKRTKDGFVLSSGNIIHFNVSIGVAEYPEAASTAVELINCSEIVTLKCKAMGKNAIQFFDAPIINEFLYNVEIENKLKDAIIKNSFEMYYQPQYYAGNNQLRGVEALIRWRDTDQNMISPAIFIPIAEKNGSILAIGNWVMEESIRQYAQWKNKYNIDWIISINISALQFAQDNFILSLMRMLEKYKVNPEQIELEITESILIQDFEPVSKKLHILRDNGIRISLDDFGTGYSSLGYLKKLPINTLKIDKSFIDTVLIDSSTRIITESIIDMVKSLGFESIAEGVEDERQYRYLHAIGCDIIQGYYMAKPLPASGIEEVLSNT